MQGVVAYLLIITSTPSLKASHRSPMLLAGNHNHMGRILLALVIDAPLHGGFSNVRLVRAVCALMDFTFIAQYPVHTGETVELMEDALLRYHENLSIFHDLGLCQHFNLPKLHFASHYGDLIKVFGTTDNFNTESTKRLHIDMAQDAYNATNYKDKFSQMTVWQEWKEKIHEHTCLVKQWLEGSPPIDTPPNPAKCYHPGSNLTVSCICQSSHRRLSLWRPSRLSMAWSIFVLRYDAM